jgi:outer membrane protein insertion porin family
MADYMKMPDPHRLELASDGGEKRWISRKTTLWISRPLPDGRWRKQGWMGQRILTGVLFFLFVQAALLEGDGRGQELAKVGILPFEVHAAQREKLADWPKEVDRILSRELGKDERIIVVGAEEIREALTRAGPVAMNEQLAREIGRVVDADYMIVGSITQVEGTISLDARILEIHLQGVLASAFVVGKGPEELESMARQLSQELNFKILRKELIAKVLIEGNKAIEENAIRSQIKMKDGDIFSPRGLREDLKSIYQMGYFQDVRAEKRDWGREKAIVFIVEEKPVIREIRFSGNKAIKTSDLQEILTLKPRTILNLNAVKENLNKIIQKYHDDAYYAAEVKYELETPKKGDVIIHFIIEEHKKILIKSITFSGNHHFSNERLRKLLTETKQAGFFSFLNKSGVYKAEVLERDLDAVVAFYLQKGFLEVKVGKPQAKHDQKWIWITIPVEEGRQFRVGKVDIQGDLIAPKHELFRLVNLYVGEILNRDRVRESITNLTDRYANKGYAFVDITPQTVVHKEGDFVDLTFEIAQGRQVYFERMNILGNTKTRDKVIRRELPAEGELYSSEALKRARESLNRLGFFKEVNLTTKKGSADDKLDLTLQVEEGPTGSFSVGGGYSTLDKFVGTVSISQRNLFGRGQQLTLAAQFGSVSQYYNLSFTEPRLLDTPISGRADLYNVNNVYDDFTARRTGGGVTFGFPLFELSRGYIGYKYEEVDISNVASNASFILQQSVGISDTSAVSLTLRRDSRDHYFDPSKGSDNSFTLQYAGGPLGGTNYFTKFDASSAWFTTPFWKLTYMARGRIGYIHGNDGHVVPLYERYRLGGIYTVRGFKAWSIGPKAPNGEVIGGDKELIFNLEMIFPLVPEVKIKGVVFFDAGNSWDVAQPIALDDMRTSVGFGFRWISPVGPLRIEWGYNLSPKPGESQSSWDFTIGGAF